MNALLVPQQMFVIRLGSYARYILARIGNASDRANPLSTVVLKSEISLASPYWARTRLSLLQS